MNLKFNTITNNRLANLEIFPAFAAREIGIRRRNRHTSSTPFDLTPLLESFECLSTDKYSIVGEDDGTLVPPLACEFCKVSSASHVLALADENGYLVLHNTRKTGSETEIKDWQAHSNAIFDISWAEGEEKLLTAAGDQTAVLWDVHRCEKVDVYKGHNSSIKSIAFRRRDDAVFATGSRDGHIMIWDRRCTQKDGHIPPVNSIHNAHALPLTVGGKQRRKSKLGPALDSQQSVTSVAFQSDVYLASAGAVDGTIKVWDLRKNYTVNSTISQPRFIYPYQGTSVRKHGFSSIVFDTTGTRLFASATDDNIYQYDFASYTQPPVACYRGHKNNTFYIKTALSPDNQFLLSGSSDDNAYIWQVDRPYSSPIILKGHWAEVTGVSWNELDFGKIATISDDCTMRLWRLHRRVDPPRPGEVSGTAEKTHKEIGVGSTVGNQCSPCVTTTPMATSEFYSPSLWQLIPVTPGKSMTPAAHGLKTITPSKDRKLSMKPPSNVTPSSKQSSPKLCSPSIKEWFQFRPQQNDSTENGVLVKNIKDVDENHKDCSGNVSTDANVLKITPIKRGLDHENLTPSENFNESQTLRHSIKRPNCKRKLIEQDGNDEQPMKRTNILHDVTNEGYSVDSKMNMDMEGCLSVSEKFSKTNTDIRQSPTMKLPNLVEDQMVKGNSQRGKENLDSKDKAGKLDWLTMLRIQRLKDQYSESLEKTPEKIKLPSGMSLPNNITPTTSPCRNVASPSRMQESPVRGMKSIKNYFGGM